MGLHDRIKNQTSPAPGETGNETPISLVGAPQREREEPRTVAVDPYAELKTRVHHACIAKLGPQLFTTETTEELHEQVHRAVTEQLALDRTPLTREERRRIVRELTDDILGYGPLEPLLRDDSITEVMCNNWDRIYIERDGKIEQRRRWSTRASLTEAA
jgi:pilus assembly protein CpaF